MDVLKIERAIKYIPIKIRNFFYLPKIIKKAKEESYYPELSRKCLMRRILDNVVWTFRYDEINDYYNLYGFDIKKKISGIDQKKYNDYRNFSKVRDSINNKNMVGAIRDKFAFYTILKAANVPTPEVYRLIEKHGTEIKICFTNGKPLPNDFFAKTTSGVCGDGVHHLYSESDIYKLKDGVYILQEALIQSKDMNEIYNGSINTIRLITVNNHGNVEIFCSVLRIGTSKTHGLDNWGQGGIAVVINDDGILEKKGCYKPEFKEKDGLPEKHPDTNFIFEGYQIPGYKEAVKIAIEAHKLFTGVKFIGWDIAMTEKGPYLIEGNDNFELSLFQHSHPMNEKWYSMVEKVKD